jgi:DNA-binding CsgD family transcriptional regulator
MFLRESNRNGAGPDGRGAISSSSLRAIVSWCEALNGTIPLQSALSDLATGLGAEAGMIVRTQMKDLQAARIASCDLAGPGSVWPLQRSFADSYFGGAISRARASTIWHARTHADDASGDLALADWQASRRMKEFVVLILASNAQTRDHVELHFREHLSAEVDATLAAMLPDMTRVWASRRIGIVTGSIIAHRSVRPEEPVSGRRPRILGSDNPHRLSRAEFRVCVLLSNGLSVRGVARELGLTDATIRTHLRNIYCKAQCSSLSDLVFRLMDGRSIEAVPTSMSA